MIVAARRTHSPLAALRSCLTFPGRENHRLLCSETAGGRRLTIVGGQEAVSRPDPVAAIYRRALPHVYGYLLSRCGSVSLAEDLTADTFMAAVAATRQQDAGTPEAPEVTVSWLVGVARHKLADHWRRTLREESTLAAAGQLAPGHNDPWDEWLDTEAAYAALRCLNEHQRAALTLRYLDGLPVAEVAALLGRTLTATETLLIRAKAALRRVYQDTSQDSDREEHGHGH